MAAVLCFITSTFWGPLRSHFQGATSGGCSLLTKCLLCQQAKYLAQIIVMGAQVVGRAFARALRQEFAGKLDPSLSLGWELLPRSDFPRSNGPPHAGPVVNAGFLWVGVLAAWVAWGTPHGWGQ